MTTPVARTMHLACVALLVVAAAGCSRNPETKARSHAAKADAYVEQRQLSEAIIEYRNAIKTRPEWAEAHYKLAKAYMRSGDPVKAYGAYSRAADLDPSNIDAQIQAGTLLLAGGEYDRARTRAELALKADEKSAAAHTLMGNALAGLKDTRRALQEIEQAIAIDPASAPAWSALGAVRFVGGSREAAGDAFQKAVDVAPNAVEPRLALANYQWATGDVARAEATLKGALSLGSNAAAHRALALMYLTTQRVAEAEPHFRALAEQDPGARLNLADYYAVAGRRDEAATVLRAIQKEEDKAQARAARLRLASLEYSAGRKAEAHAMLDALITEKPRDVDARVAKARTLLTEGRADEAVTHAREAIKADSGSADAQYTLGLAVLAMGDAAEAERAFGQVLSINPRASAARLQLSRIHLAKGDAARAYATAEDAARQRPDDAAAAVLMVRSLRAQGDLARAHREVSSSLGRHGHVAELHAEMGWIALVQRDHKSAAASFGEALRLAPRLHEARVGVITVHVAQSDFAGARARLQQWLAESPNDTQLHVLSARTSLAAGRTTEAEQELRAVVTADASQLEGYDLLGRIYVSQGQLDRALSEYETLAGRSKRQAGPRTMIGMIHEANGDRASARAAYEAALQADAAAGVAANNLAWMLAEDGRLDDALRLASVAKEQLRQRPEAEDTVGWVYYKKNLPGHAIPAFERAIERAPENPTYYYHLGLAHLQAGHEKQGRTALQRALALKADFAGADDARARLAAPVAGDTSVRRSQSH
jgi:putative PEP-CTERM system TPR-repeat lipoprotein